MDLITTHLNADFDGLASMVAARKLYPGAVLVLPGGAQESVRGFLATHHLDISRLKDVALERVRRLILVDVQEPERLGPLKTLSSRADVRCMFSITMEPTMSRSRRLDLSGLISLNGTSNRSAPRPRC